MFKWSPEPQMTSLSRRSLLEAGTGLAVAPLSGCVEWIRCRDVGGEQLSEPHLIVVEAVRDDPAGAFPIELTYPSKTRTSLKATRPGSRLPSATPVTLR